MAYISYEQIAVLGVVLTVSALTIPANATSAEIQAQDDGDVNYTLDGTSNPGASSGMILQAGNTPKEILIDDLRNIRFVKSAANTFLNVHYFAGRSV